MNKIICVCLLVLGSSVVAADIEFYSGARPNAPFSEGVRIGDAIFLSGRLGISKGKLVEGGIQGQTRAAMESIKSSVEKFGSSMDRIAKCTVFMTDMKEFSQMNEVYLSFFEDKKPARSAVEVSGLAFDAKIEIECIVAVGE